MATITRANTRAVPPYPCPIRRVFIDDNLDLNLLVSLDALLRERNVTRAAERLGLSQPALSSALRRLRRHFGDELLARVGNSYQLTPLAVFLASRVTGALAGVERVFDAQPEFDPAHCRREFTLVASDYALAVVGPPLVSAMTARAPHARLRFRQPTLSQVPNISSDLHTADALIFPHGFFGGLPCLDLVRDRWVCIVDAAHDEVGELSVEQLSTMPWVSALSEPSAYLLAHKQLELMSGVALNIQIVTDGFLAVPSLVAGTGRVALIQERLARAIPPELRIRVVELPFAARPIVEALWWHPLAEPDPEHQLLRAVFTDVATALAVPVG